MIRIQILHVPPGYCIDGIRLDLFQVGLEYEVGDTFGALLIAEGWAKPLGYSAHESNPAPRVEIEERPNIASPPNLIRDSRPFYPAREDCFPNDRRWVYRPPEAITGERDPRTGRAGRRPGARPRRSPS